MLTSKAWWEDLIRDLLVLFRLDADFDSKLFRRQIAVMKGQVYNLVQVLRMGFEDDKHVDAAKSVGIHVQGLSRDESSSVATTDNPSPDNPALIGTPLDLVNMPSCLVWEDEDVRDLVGGEFSDLERDGMLGTIIGGIDTAPQSPSSPTRIDISPTDNRAHSAPDEDIIGDFLTKHESMLSSSHDPGYLHAADASRRNAHRGRHRFRASELSHGLDAFRGRIITFVKSQPWFRNW